MTTIELTNSGPIEGTFTIDLSSGPGAYEFRGARGTGKTTCISSIDWLTGHRVDVTLHDAAISGKVEGFGVVAPIGGRKRRKGDFSLDTIDAEKFSLGDLIDPPGKTPEVRDAHAIKALAVLSEAGAEPKLYYPLAGGQSSFNSLGVAETKDPVLLATRVKQAYDKCARDLQNIAEAEGNHATPLEHVPDDLDISKSCDLPALGLARDSIRDELQRLSTARENGIVSEHAVAKAKERLRDVGDGYSGPTIAEATAQRQATIDNGVAAKEEVAELERQLAHARNASDACKGFYASANQTLEAATSHFAALAALEVEASKAVTYPEQNEVDAAEVEVDAATEAYNAGVRIREVKLNLDQAKGHRDSANAAEKQAVAARNKAAQVFDILAKSLHTTHLEIKSVDGAPRLFVNHPKRGQTAFDRVNGLSDGERVDYTLRELMPHLQSPGMLPIPQRIWQDLQPTDRQELHELAVEKGLFLFGAQVDDGDLRIVYLGDD